MAITLIQTPATHAPCFNDQWFTATSSQIAQPNFQFYVTITVHYHNGTFYTTDVSNEAINTPPDNILRFNAMSYGKKFIKHYIPISTSGWQQCLNGVLKIIVNVGERYGTTPTVHAGANTTYYVWNGISDFISFSGYTATPYVATAGSAFPILNSYPDTRIGSNSQAFLHILCSSDNELLKMRVSSTDGILTSHFDIINPLLASGNWYDRYLCMNISPVLLAAIGGVNWIAVTGTQFTITLYDTGNVVRKSITFDYSDICSKFYKYGLIYLSRAGGFDHLNFEMVSEEEYDVVRTNVKHTQFSDPAATGTQTYTQFSQTLIANTTKINQSIKIRSNWISETQSATLKELIASNKVYIQDLMIGGIGYIYPVLNKDSKYQRKRNFNGKLFNIEANVDFAHDNFSQEGA